MSQADLYRRIEQASRRSMLRHESNRGNWRQRLRQVISGMALLAGMTFGANAADILVADRLTNSVYRYSQTGDYLGTVLTDHENLNQATGLALSPDLTKLYVSGLLNSQVMRYDYDYATGTATNGEVFAKASDGLAAPNAILFSEDGETILISNLGEVGLARFNLDGSSAGEPLWFGEPHTMAFTQFSGLEYAPNGGLLVGAFLDSLAGANGAIGHWNPALDELEMLLEPSPSLAGTSGLLVHEDYLYVTGMFASNIQRFDLTTGLRDPNFEITGLGFPQGLMHAPDGNGFLVGILGYADGQGHIAHYDFDGNLVGDGVFALSAQGTEMGFREVTAMIVVPELGLPGDFNGDGMVDAADYTLWRNHFGTSFDLGGNGDESGASKNIVDTADYLLWKAQFGRSLAVAPLHTSPTQVPEPRSALLVAILIAWIGFSRRR